MGEGPQAFEGFTYCGFRYLQVDNPGQSLGAGQLVAIARHAAMPDAPMATFSTGNRTLDAVWKLNARSCLYCSQEQFVDTPTREKGQFVWDASNESEGVMRAYGDQNLSWQGLRDVMRGQRRYWPDGQVNAVYPNDDGARSFGTFTARYPEWVWRYYASTGDRATAILFYASVSQVAAWLWSVRQAGNGLLYGLADQSNGDPVYGYDLSVAADTASNVLAVNAFNRVAQLAEVAGDTAGVALWQGRAAAALGRHQRDPAASRRRLRRRRRWPVGRRAAPPLRRRTPSRWPTASFPPRTRQPSARTWPASGIHLGPNHGLELLRGLTAAGRPDAVVQTLTDRSIPGWAHIVAAGGTFTWEVWSPSDLIGDSMSHGWGSSALVAMQETLLGVSFRAPGPDGTTRLTIAPPLRGPPPCVRLRADGRRPRRRGLAADRRRHDARSGGAGERRASWCTCRPPRRHRCVRAASPPTRPPAWWCTRSPTVSPCSRSEAATTASRAADVGRPSTPRRRCPTGAWRRTRSTSGHSPGRTRCRSTPRGRTRRGRGGRRG